MFLDFSSNSSSEGDDNRDYNCNKSIDKLTLKECCTNINAIAKQYSVGTQGKIIPTLSNIQTALSFIDQIHFRIKNEHKANINSKEDSKNKDFTKFRLPSSINSTKLKKKKKNPIQVQTPSESELSDESKSSNNESRSNSSNSSCSSRSDIFNHIKTMQRAVSKLENKENINTNQQNSFQKSQQHQQIKQNKQKNNRKFGNYEQKHWEKNSMEKEKSHSRSNSNYNLKGILKRERKSVSFSIDSKELPQINQQEFPEIEENMLNLQPNYSNMNPPQQQQQQLQLTRTSSKSPHLFHTATTLLEKETEQTISTINPIDSLLFAEENHRQLEVNKIEQSPNQPSRMNRRRSFMDSTISSELKRSPMNSERKQRSQSPINQSNRKNRVDHSPLSKTMTLNRQNSSISRQYNNSSNKKRQSRSTDKLLISAEQLSMTMESSAAVQAWQAYKMQRAQRISELGNQGQNNNSTGQYQEGISQKSGAKKISEYYKNKWNLSNLQNYGNSSNQS